MTTTGKSAPKGGPDRIMLPAFYRDAQIVPGSLDEKERTFDIVLSAGAAVPRYDWSQGVRYMETLNLDPKSVRLDRLQSGRAPVLDAHQRSQISNVIGNIVKNSVKIGDGQMTAKVRMSGRPDVAGIVGDVRDGIIANVSPGYLTHAYTETVKDGLTYRDATDWEPIEGSFVPVGADPDAGMMRGAPQGELYPCIITRAALEEMRDTSAVNSAAAAARMRMRARALGL